MKALDVNAGELPAVPADTAEALFVTDRKYDGSDELVKASDAGLSVFFMVTFVHWLGIRAVSPHHQLPTEIPVVSGASVYT